MPRVIAISVFAICSFMAPSAGWAVPPGDAMQPGAESHHWIRRQAQVAKVRTDRLPMLREHTSQSAAAIEPILAKHHVKNQHLFTAELEPGEHVALRYFEYE